MTADRTIRAEVYFSGDVQGVGFRFTTRSIAQGFDVTGYVRNLPDGRVEVVAEGRKPEVDAFLGEISSRMGGHIADQARDDRQATGEFAAFEIRH